MLLLFYTIFRHSCVCVCVLSKVQDGYVTYEDENANAVEKLSCLLLTKIPFDIQTENSGRKQRKRYRQICSRSKQQRELCSLFTFRVFGTR